MPLRVAITTIVAVIGIGALGAVTSDAVTSSKVVAVKMNEFNIVPAKQAAPAGKVTFVVKNVGKVTHEFVVIKTNKPAGNLLKGDEADETGAVGEIGPEDLEPGTTTKLTLKLKKGHYALLCNLPGHYRAGQFVDFYVR